jgi:hypothetical protein
MIPTSPSASFAIYLWLWRLAKQGDDWWMRDLPDLAVHQSLLLFDPASEPDEFAGHFRIAIFYAGLCSCVFICFSLPVMLLS